MAPPNWDTYQQIRDHKLAASIINGHGTDHDAVFDEVGLEKLRQFVKDPASRTELLKTYGWDDPAARRDLVGHLVFKHGTEDPAFDERDLEMLSEWFEKGMPVGEVAVR